MIVFASKLSDILFGVFLPIGALILVGLIVTFMLAPKAEQEKTPPIPNAQNFFERLLRARHKTCSSRLSLKYQAPPC